VRKTVKLEEDIYNDLDRVRGKRETFSQAVARILNVYKTVQGIRDTIEPARQINGVGEQDH